MTWDTGLVETCWYARVGLVKSIPSSWIMLNLVDVFSVLHVKPRHPSGIPQMPNVQGDKERSFEWLVARVDTRPMVFKISHRRYVLIRMIAIDSSNSSHEVFHEPIENWMHIKLAKNHKNWAWHNGKACRTCRKLRSAGYSVAIPRISGELLVKKTNCRRFSWQDSSSMPSFLRWWGVKFCPILLQA